MKSRTEYGLEHIEPGPFEKLAIDILTRNGYREIDPQGTRGPDGGKDGLILDGDEGNNVIAHFSVQQDWKQKLRSDLQKTAAHNRDYDTVVFVTNRDISGVSKTDIPEEVESKYGWELDLWGQQKLRRELDNHHLDLRARYLGISPEGTLEDAEIQSQLRKQGFEWITDEKLLEGLDNPDYCWRRPFSLTEVNQGYAIDRQKPDEERTNVTTEIVVRLQDGGQEVVLGPPGSGKSTICKSIICRWHNDENTGPVIYHRQGRAGEITDVNILSESVEQGKVDGSVLVVVDNATSVQVSPIFDLIADYPNDEKVSFLLNAREYEWESFGKNLDGSRIDIQSEYGRQLVGIQQEQFHQYFVPELDLTEVQRLIDRFEEVTGRGVFREDEHIFEKIKAERGVSPMLLLTYYLPLANESLDETGQSRLDDNIVETYEKIVSGSAGDGVDDRLATDAALLIHILNATDVGNRREYIHTLASTSDDHVEIDKVLSVYEGILLFGEGEDGEWFSHHPLWSTKYLVQHLEEQASVEIARSDFERCVNRLFSFADDDELQNSISDWLGIEERINDIRNHRVGFSNFLVMEVFRLGTKNQTITSLYGDHHTSNIQLPSACSDAAVINCHLLRANMLRSRGEFDSAHDELEYARSRVSEVTSIDSEMLEMVFHNELGLLEKECENYELALEHFEDGVDLAKEIGDDERRCGLLNNMSNSLVQIGDLQRGQEVAQKTLQLAETISSLEEEANALATLGSISLQRTELNEAKQYFQRALEIRESIGSRSGIADQLNNLGIIYRRDRGLEEAGQYFRESLRLKKESGLYVKQISTLNNLAALEYEKGDFDDAIEYYRRAEDIAEDVGQKEGLAKAKKGRADIAFSKNDVELAEKLYERSLEIADELQNVSLQADCLEGLGNTALEMGNLKEAREYLEVAKSKINQTEQRSDKARISHHLGNAYLASGDLENARSAYRASLDLYTELGDIAGRVDQLLNLGQMDIVEGKTEEGLQRYREAYKVSKERKLNRRALRACNSLVESHERLNQGDKALEWCDEGLEYAQDNDIPDIDGLVTSLSIHRDRLEISEGSTLNLYSNAIEMALNDNLQNALHLLHDVWIRRGKITDIEGGEVRKAMENSGVFMAAVSRVADDVDLNSNELLDGTNPDLLSPVVRDLYQRLLGNTPDRLPDEIVDDLDHGEELNLGEAEAYVVIRLWRTLENANQ